MKTNELETGKLPFLFLRFVLPAVISMVLAGTQSMVDGLFLGKYASTNAMASVNIAIPYMQMIIGCTMIVCSGTISFLGRTLGRKSDKAKHKAQDIFRSSLLALLACSGVLMLLGMFANAPLAVLMGANDILLADTARYIFVLSFFTPAICFMILFGFTARLLGKPQLYLIATLTCLAGNVTMDFIAIKILHLGATGAALATGFSYAAGLLITIRPLLKKQSVINIYTGKFRFSLLRHTVLNGSSEGVNSLATAVTVWLFNTALMNYAGESGVAAFTVINYISNFVILVMFGVADGIGTMVSYNYGAGHLERVRKILRLALLLNLISGTLIFLILKLFSRPLIALFIPDQPAIMQMAVQGAQLYSIAFLLNGFNIVHSGYQTALGNAVNSALIAGSRGLIFISAGMLLLPKIFAINGVWLSVPFAELITVLICILLDRREYSRQRQLFQLPQKAPATSRG